MNVKLRIYMKKQNVPVTAFMKTFISSTHKAHMAEDHA